jgi:hypothetical protein
MTFLSDQETQIDLLYYESIAKTLSKLVQNTPMAPITIGVHGDWGAGKSSVLKMVEAQLRERPHGKESAAETAACKSQCAAQGAWPTRG